MDKLEKAIAKKDVELGDSKYYTKMFKAELIELQEDKKRLEQELEAAVIEWEASQETLDKMGSEYGLS